MKPRFCVLMHLRRIVLSSLKRPYTHHRMIHSLTNHSTKFLNELEPPKEEETDQAKDSLELLKSWGCNEDDISKLFSRNPGLKNAKIADLESKLGLLSSLGVAAPEIVKIVKCRPRFLSCRLNRHFDDRLEFLATLFPSKTALAKAIVRNPSLLTYDFHAKVAPTVQLYERLGLSKADLAAMLAHRPTLLSRTSFDDEKAEYVRKIGASVSPKLLKYVVTIVGVSRTETIREKVANLEQFGFSEDEVLGLFRRCPFAMTLSAEKVERNVRFVLATMSLPAEAVLRYPGLLFFNLEGVLRPRVLLLQKVREMGLQAEGIEEGEMMRSLRMKEDRFFEVFVAAQPAEVRKELAAFYAKAKEMKRLAVSSKLKKHGGFPF